MILSLALYSTLLPAPFVRSMTSSSSKVPMSLSTVINDLEAEGDISGISTSTFLTSRSSSLTRGALLKKIAFGTSTEEGIAASEEAGEDVTTAGRIRNGVGFAFVCASSAAEASSTVIACGKTVVFVASEVDLNRGGEEGLFDTLAPAVETILNNCYGGEDTMEKEASTLIVLLEGDDIDASKAKFEQEASKMVANLAGKERATRLSDVFDRVVYLSTDGDENDILDIMNGGSLREPSDAQSSVAQAAYATLFSALEDKPRGVTSSDDVAAIRTIQPVIQSALSNAVKLVTDNASSSDGSGTNLVANFGELCDAAVSQAMDTFDAAAEGSSTGSPVLIKRKRADLMEELVSELEQLYDLQMAELKTAFFDLFKKKLSGLRVSPALANDMEEVMKESLKEFATAADKMRVSSSTCAAASTWTSGMTVRAEFRKKMKEYCTDRLQVARVAGNYRPAPRKAVTIGLHWLLPKPFGADYRQPAGERELLRNFVYHPESGRVEVTPDEVKQGTGGWRSNIVPCPPASDIIYQGEQGE
eukprot:CAMPEP_0195523480 /NCGR_PEP_ID=MMETSP0794_2-20130614/22699_1 /TAXON_ID=515487 /ORGANISM="Stephanopyxis turris, Strain CCMP 815" /LENGTH=531 /DNA_ID=CAMNT_0040653491 /DNA_START=224 /DNA_END=1819 /DNA_ORIENTATION=-